MSLSVIPIRAFNDNYIWAIVHPEKKQIIVVDPGDAKPAIHFLKEYHYQLSGILITHHHHDHTGGINTLQQHFDCPTYGPHNSPDRQYTFSVNDGDTIDLPQFNLKLNVIEIPGHTLDHIAFYNDEWLFCGDTLFAAGCGRVFEGTPKQMLSSLDKLAALSPSLQIFCGHEYTLNNLQFAATLEPNNKALQHCIQKSQLLLGDNKPTLPTLLGDELTYNPFLRCRKNTIITAANRLSQQHCKTPVDVFTAIREEKNKH